MQAKYVHNTVPLITLSIFMHSKDIKVEVYRIDPKFSDTQALANSADPDQTAPLGAA